MEKARPAPGHPSTYGQACMQCYKAKCRCVPRSRGDSCERCHRLRKECLPSDSTRRRNADRAEESGTRIAQLEGKIEMLLSAVQSIVSSSGSSAEALRLLNEERIPSSTAGPNDTPANSISTNPSISGVPTPATDPSPLAQAHTDPCSPSQYSPSPSEPSPRQAEECLSFFRSRMLPYFPFINLTPDIAAWQLRHTRPFLFQAILVVTTFSTQKRLAQIEELKRILFTSALLEVQSSIDLLLGLLTYLAWSNDAFLGRADLISRLMILAISLVYDLRLFKPLPPDTILMMAITQGQDHESDQNPNDETFQGFMEKQRAVLACFVLSSNISSHLGRIDALRWTPQMEEALRIIEMNKSCLTDEAFAFQVRLQLLKQRAAHIREQQIDGARTATASVTTSVPGLLYLKTLREQLHELKSSFPPDLLQRGAFITHAHYVDLYINQLAYSISWDSPPLNLLGPRSDGGHLPGFERLKCLWWSVESIKSWLDSFYKISPSDLVGLPFHFWSQMIMCVTILKYLSVLEDPAWNRQEVRNTVDLIATMDCMIQKLDRVCIESNFQCDDSIFNLLSKLLSKCRVWAGARLNTSQIQDAEAGPYRSADPCETSHNSSIPDLDQMIWMQSMDLEDDQWFEDAMNLPAPFL
ncbi:uncharacterized protein BDZ99DRAFT_251042 [Mytilinidion resinicola]|uniref:Zn(2)-C6 fungal-type domain-containing protein n=1 Tax=Mytilinidion resinicola TaxID=574789 RepID=A0A6A6YYU8_9PEZI|nr:uncharacterized protein BDZ99DRAFT_251042 [Mytilinidion resinicola]KAF2813174.1 hypothetical protein BDZ99DRAFT_251042 [Mytilinidion resinicola]